MNEVVTVDPPALDAEDAPDEAVSDSETLGYWDKPLAFTRTVLVLGGLVALVAAYLVIVGR